MKMQTPKIVQSRSRWVYLWAMLPILLGAMLMLGWGDYIQIKRPPVDKVTPLTQQLAEQRELIERLESQRDHLREQVAALERASQIDQESIRQVREELRKRQTGYLEMEQELNLLRGIVETGVKSEGLYIQGFKLDKSDQPDSYHFRFTVSQALKNAGTAVGWILLALEGEQGGETVELPLKALTKEKDEKLKMRFRHFQDVDGLIQLPEGFNPERVIVEINPTNNRLPKVKKSFDWLVAD
ncbi:DUF6776 family protein [Sedimenticola sp.]|uniref:DUF6776 family protein n=1 Tax=Sedimenticola sp. TaxID=1940285 RepID=UPI003D107680